MPNLIFKRSAVLEELKYIDGHTRRKKRIALFITDKLNRYILARHQKKC